MIIRQRESNPYRIPAALFGAFCLVVLALRQQGGVRRDKNPSNIPHRNVPCSFYGADFCPGKETGAENTWRIFKTVDAAWAEIRPKKPARVRLPLPYVFNIPHTG